MAKRKTNKAAAIRDYIEANPTSKPKAIAAALAEKGLKVNTAYISMIKTKMKKTGGLRGRKATLAVSRNGRGEITVNDLLVVKEMARRLGGADRARAALDALARLA